MTWWSRSFAVLMGVALLASCGSKSTETQVDDANLEPGACGQFVIFESPEWDLLKAIDYPEDLGEFAAIEPSLDWSAEYERLTPSADGAGTNAESLRISGHTTSIDTHKTELTGAQLSETQIDGKPALAGNGPDGQVAFVTIQAAPEYTLMLLSYGATSDELTEIASEIEQVCEAEWIEAGGQILDCMPTDPEGCDSVESG